jgi:hypothetical protein
MKKRALAGVLWFYASWYAWGMVASFTDLPGAVGPIGGACLGLFVALDPLGRLWKHTAEPAPVAAPEPQGALRS